MHFETVEKICCTTKTTHREIPKNLIKTAPSNWCSECESSTLYVTSKPCKKMASNSSAKCSQNTKATDKKHPVKDGMHVGNMNMIAIAIAISTWDVVIANSFIYGMSRFIKAITGYTDSFALLRWHPLRPPEQKSDICIESACNQMNQQRKNVDPVSHIHTKKRWTHDTAAKKNELKLNAGIRWISKVVISWHEYAHA